jgi:transcriptional regulator with PAS, ATPase and Fis domain
MRDLLFSNQLSQEEQALLQIIIQSLPYIAQVVGGDVVLFDRNGVRNEIVNTDGTQNIDLRGSFNELCKSVMANMRPSIGPSTLAKGSMAVRIPLNAHYGIAFNNRTTIQRQQKLLEESQRYQTASYQTGDILGDSKALGQAKALIPIAARSSSSVLICGETGTGKELFAHAVHNASARSTKPFIAVNCGAVPENLVESVFFGYREGAFTGASKGGQNGVIERANGGTVFFDEISEMPLSMQVKFLRVLQDKEVTRLGESKPRKVDVRFIAATNKNLPELVEKGDFRADLYYRLNVIALHVPPLRARKSDIPALVNHFVNKYAGLLNKNPQEIPISVMEIFQAYDWPGNVREVQNCVEYAVNMLEGGEKILSEKYLPPILRDVPGGQAAFPASGAGPAPLKGEREMLLGALMRNRGYRGRSAKELGMSRTTFWRKAKKYDL